MPMRPARHRLQSTGAPQARAQLTLVEHALCPLDAAASLRPGLLFETSYQFSDRNRNRRRAQARIGALDGLSAHDELYLWGLLALALAQNDSRPELLATPYWCLRNLGLIDGGKRGGKEFELFRAAIRRLAGVRYQNDAFYDPVRGEHRQVSFGFLNYSLPLNPESSRTWRFAWDPIFFEFAKATGGALSFDLGLYRRLDASSRRLYLLLKKLFWRSETTPALELRHLAVDVLGFSATLRTTDLRKKVTGCLRQLLKHDLVRMPPHCAAPRELFHKQGKGVYTLVLHRGPAFATGGSVSTVDSPLVDPLRAIGFDEGMIRRILRQYPAKVIEQWADITLAARERHGEAFFTASPQAYFLDNLKAAASDGRTPPDWWRDLRKQELQREREQERSKAALLQPDTEPDGFDEYLKTEAKDAFERVMQKLAADLRHTGKSEEEAQRNAAYHARVHLWNRYRREHPESHADGFRPLDSLL